MEKRERDRAEYLDSYVARLTKIEDSFNAYRANGSLDALNALKNDSNYADLLQKWLNIAQLPDSEQALQQLRDGTVPLSKLSPYADIMLHCQNEWTRDLNLIHIVYVWSGTFACELGTRHFPLQRGWCYIFNSHVRKGILPASEDAEMINCLISKKYMEDILFKVFDREVLFADFLTQSFYTDSYTEPVLEFDTRENREVRHSIAAALMEFVDRNPFYNEMVNSYVYLLISHLLRLYTASQDFQHYVGLGNNKLSDVLIYMDDNCAHTTLADVAANFHFHPNYLSKIIKRHTNSSFTEILQNTRLKKAAFLLRNTDLPISEIAQQIGYSNVSHFYNMFKAKYGCTPAQYRKSAAGNPAI